LKVRAFALNRLDIWSRQGAPGLKMVFPHVGASDFAGEIEDMGSETHGFAIGDRVVVNAGISCRKCAACLTGEHSLCPSFHLLGEHVWGGAAEFAKVPFTNIVRIPKNISFEEAAAAALTSLTVFRMVVSKAKLKEGEKVLVIGTGGGIGTIALQMCKSLGASVIALTSGEAKIKLAQELGADHVIDYKLEPQWGKVVWEITNKEGIDVVVDSTGEVIFEQAIRSLAKGGRFVTCGATSGFTGKVNLGSLFWKQLSIFGSTMASDREFKEAMNLVFNGKIKPIISKILPFEKIKEAHTFQEDPSHMGKVVVTLP